MIEAVEVVIRQPGFPDRVQRLNDGATRIGRAEDNEDIFGAHDYTFTAWDLGNRLIGREGDLFAV